MKVENAVPGASPVGHGRSARLLQGLPHPSKVTIFMTNRVATKLGSPLYTPSLPGSAASRLVNGFALA